MDPFVSLLRHKTLRHCDGIVSECCRLPVWAELDGHQPNVKQLVTVLRAFKTNSSLALLEILLLMGKS